MPRAKLDALKNYEIDCPPIVDQVARTTRLDEIVTAAEICREQIEKYDLLIKARLNKIAARWPAKAVAQFYFIDK